MSTAVTVSAASFTELAARVYPSHFSGRKGLFMQGGSWAAQFGWLGAIAVGSAIDLIAFT